MNTSIFPKRIREKIEVIELKREFGLAEYYFYTYKGNRSIDYCILSKDKYFCSTRGGNYLRMVENPNEVLNILTNPKVRFHLEGKTFANLQELYEEVLVMRLAGI